MQRDGEESELYRRLMALKPDGLSRNAWAVKAGLNRSVFNDIRSRGRIKTDTLEKLLEAIGVSYAQYEQAGTAQPNSGTPAPVGIAAPKVRFGHFAATRDVPVVGTAHGGTMKFETESGSVEVEETLYEAGQIIDYVRRPPGIEARKDVFAVEFQGESMAPRYEPGDLGYVDPRRSPSIGDYVLVQLNEHHEEHTEVVAALVKRLVRRGADWIELEQFNPPATFRVEKARIHSVLRIIPMRELLGY